MQETSSSNITAASAFFLQKLALVAIATGIVGCAATPEKFRSDPTALSDVTVCRTVKKADSKGDVSLSMDAQLEMAQRGLSPARCKELIAEQNALIAGAVVVAAAVIAIAAESDSGGSSGYSPASTGYDYEWGWDQFRNEYGTLVWACRGVQTGQFAESRHCAGMAMTDWRWPSY